MTSTEVFFMQMHHKHRSFPPQPLTSSLSILSSEYQALKSGVLRVVHHGGQRDAGDDVAASAVTAVAGEILQEAAEHVGAALRETLGGEGGASSSPLRGSNGAVKGGGHTQIRWHDSLNTPQETQRRGRDTHRAS